MISPYDASFQLSYLYQSGIIDIVYGSTDLLLTKIDKFILGMEFQSKDFRFVNKNKVLKGLNLSERQFLDLCIIVGCGSNQRLSHYSRPYPISLLREGYAIIVVDILIWSWWLCYWQR